jgi:Protein of unknown function (DUF3238)
MIGNLLGISDCFMTDQRGFSNDQVFAESRMHSETTVTFTPSAGSYLSSYTEFHECGLTTELDCEDGDIENTARQTNDNMAFSLLFKNSDLVKLSFSAARNNPLWLGSPDIDLEGVLTVDRVNKVVSFQGKVDDFPAFEAYVVVNGAAPQVIRQMDPAPGAGPGDLLGSASRPFSGAVFF